jgi:hypothetical protein
MFWEVSTLNWLDEYVKPVPAVVVAPEYTNPVASTAMPPADSVVWRAPAMVDDADVGVKKPPARLMTVEVDTPYDWAVNGQAKVA